MPHRVLINGARGLIAALVVYPLAERLQRRDVRAKVRALEAEMRRDFGDRRRRSWDALVELTRFAGAHVPYYRDLFTRLAFDPEKLTQDSRYLQDLPYLTKDVIHSEGDRLLRDDHADFRKHVMKTGGSTGTSAKIVYDQDAADWSSAVTRYARRTIVDIGNRSRVGLHSELHFASRFPEAFPLADRLREMAKCWAMNRHNVFFSSFDEVELERLWRDIRSIRPYLVHCHPSTMFHLAQFVAARQETDRIFEVFESSGELLEPRHRKTIAKALQCTVIDRYGLAEVGVVAYQTDPQEPAMQVFDPFCWPELAPPDSNWNMSLHDDGRHDDGMQGELVVTPLRNRMMPLIRYRTGDLAVLNESSRGFVIVDMIGRTHDVIDIAGRRIPTHVLQDLLNRIGGIRAFQIEIEQDRPVLRIVLEPNSDPERVRNSLVSWWGDAIKLQFIEISALKLQGRRSKFRHLVDAAAPSLASTASEADTTFRP